ncbi:MAG: NAD-dependent malic enzyme, partial [Saprospiraceae bacterium]|nr:NAD-dependent malic enzyme [Saprospiraceae bacterium]
MAIKDFTKASLDLHEQHKGKISVRSKMPVTTQDDLSTVYSPGVAAPCQAIADNPEDVYKYTIKGNTVAVVSDGSAVLGLGNIGPEAAIPVMEGKAMLFKKFANIDAFPICVASQETEEIVRTVRNIAPVFGGINLEDISAPHCFVVEEHLQDLGIPVFHDDQ